MIVLISVVSALVAGMGIGGGTIFVLLSTEILSIPQKTAQTLNLILFIAVSISTSITNIKNKNIDFKIIKKMLPFLILGSLIGTSLFNSLDDKTLKTYFLYFLVIIGIYEIITSLINIKKEKNNTRINRKE